MLVDSKPEVLNELTALIKKATIDGVKASIQSKVYKLVLKLKKNNKQINESVIDRDAFLEVIKSIDGKGLSETT